jgi:hypothetical protein
MQRPQRSEDDHVDPDEQRRKIHNEEGLTQGYSLRVPRPAAVGGT